MSLHYSLCQKTITTVKYLMRRNMYEKLFSFFWAFLESLWKCFFCRKRMYNSCTKGRIFQQIISLHFCLMIILWKMDFFMSHITTSSLKYGCKKTNIFSYEFNYCIVFSGQQISWRQSLSISVPHTYGYRAQYKK